MTFGCGYQEGNLLGGYSPGMHRVQEDFFNILKEVFLVMQI